MTDALIHLRRTETGRYLIRREDGQLLYGPVDSRERCEKWMAERGCYMETAEMNLKGETKFVPMPRPSHPVTDYYRVAVRGQIGVGSERSLSGAIMPPGMAHVHGLEAVVFRGARPKGWQTR